MEQRVSGRRSGGQEVTDDRPTTAPDAAAAPVTGIEQGERDELHAPGEHGGPGAPGERDEPRAPGEPVAEPAPAVRVRGRTSVTAALAALLGLSGLYGALSGRLAPVGLALSVFGLLLAIAGLRAERPAVADRAAFDRAAAGRSRRTGQGAVRTFGRRAVAAGGLASFAVLISVAGIVVAALALGHASAWLDSDADQVSRARDWLDARLPWLTSW